MVVPKFVERLGQFVEYGSAVERFPVSRFVPRFLGCKDGLFYVQPCTPGPSRCCFRRSTFLGIRQHLHLPPHVAHELCNSRATPTQVAEQGAEQVVARQNEMLSHCVKIHLSGRTRIEGDDDLKTLSSLMANFAQPSAGDLKQLSQLHASGELFKSCCLQAVTSAANPFIPGITLSIRLDEAANEAAKQGSEGERRTIMDIKSSIDELLLEIFERLPQTVRGFEGGMNGCTKVFEPEPIRSSNESNDLGGPLDMIVSSEHQQLETFCKVPLVMDYLSRKFTLGLPDLTDSAGAWRNPGHLGSRGDYRYMESNGLVLHYGVGRLLQGVDEDAPFEVFPSQTFFPGAQFILVGVIAAPNNYYRVPAVRMMLDFVVYVGMVAALSFFVFFHTTTESVPGFAEGACALMFIMVSTWWTRMFECPCTSSPTKRDEVSHIGVFMLLSEHMGDLADELVQMHATPIVAIVGPLLVCFFSGWHIPGGARDEEGHPPVLQGPVERS